MLLKSVCLRQQKQWLSPCLVSLFAELQLAFPNVAHFGALAVAGLCHGVSLRLGNCLFPLEFSVGSWRGEAQRVPGDSVTCGQCPGSAGPYQSFWLSLGNGIEVSLRRLLLPSDAGLWNCPRECLCPLIFPALTIEKSGNWSCCLRRGRAGPWLGGKLARGSPKPSCSGRNRCPALVPWASPHPRGEEARPRLQMDHIKSKVLLTKQKNSL